MALTGVVERQLGEDRPHAGLDRPVADEEAAGDGGVEPAFTVQTLTLTMPWIQGASTAFGRHPEGSPWSYAPVNLLIYLLGLALVALGARTAARRRAKATTVDLQPVQPRAARPRRPPSGLDLLHF